MEKKVKEKSVKQPKEKKPLSKKAKIWIALSTAFVFVASAVAVVLVLVLSPRALNLHGLSVANYENYTGIGAASFDESKGATAVAYASGGKAGKEDMNLAGITKDNKCEKIEFENDNGKITKQNARLIHFDAYDKFTFFTLTTNKKYEFIEKPTQTYDNYGYDFDSNGIFSINNRGYSCKDTSFLILDNETGKIYDMKEIVKIIEEVIDVEHFVFSLMNIDDYYEMTYNVPEPVAQNYLLFKVKNYDNGQEKMQIFQAKLTNGGIEISQRLNNMQTENFLNAVNNYGVLYASNFILSDKFGNLFARQMHDGGKFLKYQKTDGTFFECEEATYTLGINSIMYKQKDSKIYFMNAKGEFEEIDFDTKIISKEAKFHYKHGNVIVVGENNKTYKITLDNEFDWKYTIEEFLFSTDFDAVAQGDFLYSFNSETKVITKFDMKTSTPEEIDSQYTFKNLTYNKNLDRASFKAVDESTQLEVDGYFDSYGEIHIGDFDSVSIGNNKVYIIKPIN